jgi:uncharacterized protein YdaT
MREMTWGEMYYSRFMRTLLVKVRLKMIGIANERQKMSDDDGGVIHIAIATAKEWGRRAANAQNGFNDPNVGEIRWISRAPVNASRRPSVASNSS